MVPLMKPESGCSVCHSPALMSFQVSLDLSVESLSDEAHHTYGR